MTKNLQELKTIIRDLVIEVGDLKDRVIRLENDIANQTLTPNSKQLEKKITQVELESYDSIGRIYNDGHHICNLGYGMPRAGECLFCIAFLQKE